MISFSHKGDFSKATKFFEDLQTVMKKSPLERLAEEGVQALSAATPMDTGKTAASWVYKIEREKDKTTISFDNTNVQNGVKIAVILQYGHGTGRGGWVEGKDYINPAIQPVFDRIRDEAWKEVTSL